MSLVFDEDWRKIKRNGPGREKTDTEFLTAATACKAMLQPTPNSKEGSFHSSGLLAMEALMFVPAIPH